MKTLFAPGCALRRYKPALIERTGRFLRERGLAEGEFLPCCKSGEEPEAEALIVCCPGCSAKFRAAHPALRIVSLWKVLADTDFPFPDYHGERMAIHDSCPARGRADPEMQDSARVLCRRMNIRLIEPEHTRQDARCCGGCAPDYETRRRMALARAEEMPESSVAVYCTGCVRSFGVTAVAPRHLMDLLYEEPTRGLHPPR